MRSAAGVLITILATIAACFGTLAVLPFSWSGRAGIRVVAWWARTVVRGVGIRLEVTIGPALGKGPYVIVANHSSLLDIPTAAAGIPLLFHFVSRPFFFKVPFLGWGMFFARHVSLDPKKPKAATKILETLHTRFENSISVLLYPEGTRSPDGTVKRYKRGPFLTAIQNGVPLLPVYIGGSAALLPKKSLWPRRGRIGVVIGAPVETKGLASEETREMLLHAKRIAQGVEQWTLDQERRWAARAS